MDNVRLDLEETLLGDLNSFQARFVALHQSIIDDGLQRSVPFHSKDIQTIIERLQSEGSSFGQVTLPLLGKALDQGLVCGRFKSPPHFAVKRNTCLPIFCHSVFRMIFDTDGTLSLSPCTESIYFLRQLLLLNGKLIYEPNTQMKERAVQDFKDRQSLLRKVKVPVDHPVLLRARWLLGRVLSRLDLSDIKPGHGPGIVADGWDRFERWDFTSWPARAERHYPYGVYGAHSFGMSSRNGIGIVLMKKMITKCCLVPKDFKGPRLISAEGTVNQYLQQGQMKSLMRYMDNHRLLSRSIRLRDQTFNQKKAQKAYGANQCTLDLSNASDMVSTVLVWYLLSDVPKLRAQLMSTRSEYMRYNDEYIPIVAFAPMGSAVCFPVETLVFWAITMASLMLVRPRYEKRVSLRSKDCKFPPFSSTLNELASEIAVFGDDIIVPNDALSTLTSTLTLVGCQVNTSKTCYLTPFRESCGSEWYNQSDVTIIRNRRYNYDADRNIRDYPVLCGLQRKFFLSGLFNTAELIAKWAREIFPTSTISILHFETNKSKECDTGRNYQDRLSKPTNFRESRHFHLSKLSGIVGQGCKPDRDTCFFTRNELPLDSFDCLLGWADACDNALPVRYNFKYQRMEFRCPREFQISRTWTTEGYPRLLARLLSDSTDRIAIRDRKVKMAWSYLPFYHPLSRIIKG